MGRYQRGIWAEYYAATFLALKGYCILKIRYKTRVGEVDLIARRGKTMVFVEVKYRQNLTSGGESISVQSKSRIRRAAEQYMVEKFSESHTMDYSIRMDALIVTHNLSIHHMKNVF